MTQLPDTALVVVILTFGASVYLLLSLIIPNSQVPLLVSIFLGTNMFSRSKLFHKLVENVTSRRRKNGFTNILGSSTKENYQKYEALSRNMKIELLTAIKSMDDYKSNCESINNRRRSLFRKMSWSQKKLAESIGYLKKLNIIDESISKNQEILDEVVKASIGAYSLSIEDFNILQNQRTASSTNYRVIEALGHIYRDWTPIGFQEQVPLLKYIKHYLKEFITEDEKLETAIIIPGSGLGRIAHELALLNFSSIHAIEYSGLMYNFNQFIYLNNERRYEFFPFNHSCSNFYTTGSQFRKYDIRLDIAKPKFLHHHHEDFLNFSLPKKEKNVVIITAFFIDTAENLLDYLDKILKLTGKVNTYWINVGPLKYGSAAQVEFSAEELTKIRKKMGWTDINLTCSLDNKDEPLVSYITDKESMWQGYYGLSMWASKKK
ncbi:uncharacterized protein PRCAT00002880001 [Priceomyces carsonii]|uniref:uncharacterized protein n=1 Tax=Priceomyces carsonii TaxID=28549 RepID=UPI002ED91634|nr:unnamed protein product [Priceomyces carsonii]